MIIVRARDKFTRWKRVKLTEEGRAFLPPAPGKPPSRRGVVIGFGHRANLVRVQRDGYSAPESFNCDFWEPA